MRIRTGTRSGVGLVTAVWTAMLVFVCVTLFLRAPRVLSAVDDFDAQIGPITDVLVVAAQNDDTLNDEQAKRLQLAIATLESQKTSTPHRVLLKQQGRMWLATPSVHPEGIAEHALALASQGQQGIATIRPRDTESHVTVGLAALGLLLTLVLIRLLVVRLVAPVEELYHYFDELQVSVAMHLFAPLPALEELETIETSLNALVGARLSYVNAQDLTLNDQAAADAMLERIQSPVWVVGRNGSLLGANDAALDLLASEEGVAIRSQLDEMTFFCDANNDTIDDESMVVPPGWEVEVTSDGDAIVCIRTVPNAGGR